MLNCRRMQKQLKPALLKINCNRILSVSLPVAYNKFYDRRQITRFNVDELSLLPEPATTFSSLYSPVNAGLQKKINAAEADTALLKAIEEKQIDTKTFDFDGENTRVKRLLLLPPN